MDERDWLLKHFEDRRPHLRAVAQKMLGSRNEADDAVQESWLRVSRAGAGGVENIGGWLTTVVARVCLDMLRARRSRREQPLPPHEPASAAGPEQGPGPEHEVLLADSVGPALLVVLDTLAPAERVAFVLHDLFGVSFEELAPIVGRTPAAARQLASRARRRVQGAAQSGDADGDRARQRRVVEAFLAASRAGDLAGLLAVLAPDVVLRADSVAVRAAAARQAMGAPPLSSEVRGAPAVADIFKGRASAAQPALIDGVVGAVWAPGGQPRAALVFSIADGRVRAIDALADPARLARLDLVMLDG